MYFGVIKEESHKTSSVFKLEAGDMSREVEPPVVLLGVLANFGNIFHLVNVSILASVKKFCCMIGYGLISCIRYCFSYC